MYTTTTLHFWLLAASPRKMSRVDSTDTRCRKGKPMRSSSRNVSKGRSRLRVMKSGINSTHRDDMDS